MSRPRLAPLALTVVLASCSRGGTSEHAGHGGHEAPAPSAMPADHTGHAAGGGSATPPGWAPIELTEAGAERIGLATTTVIEHEFEKAVRTVGAITVDETRSSHVHTKVAGTIEELSVAYTGQQVKKGQVLCRIYSPEIYAAELEFVTMLGNAGPDAGAFAEIEQAARKQAIEAAKRRLALWDVPPAEIERLERTREAKRTVELVAPRAGTVVAKLANAGQYVDASTELYLLSDLARVWAIVDLYETDAPFVKIGDRAKLTIEGLAAPIEAPIAFLPPTVDEATRTLKARFELDNQDKKLRPGAFVNAELALAVGKGLGVPESAVVRTGTRDVVFVVHGGTHVMPREVALGPLVGGYYRVQSGLSAGEAVATRAQFLLDSESRIRATGGEGAGHVH